MIIMPVWTSECYRVISGMVGNVALLVGANHAFQYTYTQEKPPPTLAFTSMKIHTCRELQAAVGITLSETVVNSVHHLRTSGTLFTKHYNLQGPIKDPPSHFPTLLTSLTASAIRWEVIKTANCIIYSSTAKCVGLNRKF